MSRQLHLVSERLILCFSKPHELVKTLQALALSKLSFKSTSKPKALIVISFPLHQTLFQQSLGIVQRINAYLVNKYERQQSKRDAQQWGLRRPYIRKPYYPVSPSSWSSSSSALSPSVGQIHTVSHEPLEGGFIHNYTRQPPSSEPSRWREQFFNWISPIHARTTPTIWAEQTLNRTRLDWTIYQGGVGTRLNPIVIEDDWFRESVG